MNKYAKLNLQSIQGVLKIIGINSVIYLLLISPSNAELMDEIKTNHQKYIVFVEENSADCAISDGKLISIQNTNQTNDYEVWVDRWFMNVQTPDHTKQLVLAKGEPVQLGCSIVRGGGSQHWTIYSVKPIQN